MGYILYERGIIASKPIIEKMKNEKLKILKKFDDIYPNDYENLDYLRINYSIHLKKIIIISEPYAIKKYNDKFEKYIHLKNLCIENDFLLFYIIPLSYKKKSLYFYSFWIDFSLDLMNFILSQLKSSELHFLVFDKIGLQFFNQLKRINKNYEKRFFLFYSNPFFNNYYSYLNTYHWFLRS